MKKILRSFTIMSLCLIIVTACIPNQATAPTIDTGAIMTQAVQTVEAKYTLTAAFQPSPSETATPLAIAPSATPLPTLTALTLEPSLTPSNAPSSNAKVIAYPAVFAVIHVFTNVDIDDIAMDCPPGYKFNFSASISTNGPGEVVYYWEFSDFSKTDNQTLTFTSAETQNISTSWEVGSGGSTPGDNPYKGWARVTIVKPNNQVFSRASFNFRCK